MRKYFLLPVFFLFIFSSCKSTKITQTWDVQLEKQSELEVFTLSLSNTLTLKNIYILKKSDSNFAGFSSSYLAAFYEIQLNENGIKKINNAAEQFISDFDNKKLNRKNTNSIKKYGSTITKLQWGQTENSTPNHGYGPVYFGYEFIKGTPYFTITVYPIHNDYFETAGNLTTEHSLELHYYFKKSQLGDFLCLTNSL